MKKPLKAHLWAFFFILFLSQSAVSSPLPNIYQSITYSLLEPVYKLFGYRELKVYVFDQETLLPIENAIVMLGDSPSTSEENKNWITTDKHGWAIFDGFLTPQGSLTISIGHPNYSRYTMLQSLGTELYIPLTPFKYSMPKHILEGQFDQWPAMEDHDGKIHLGFFTPSIPIVSLLDLTSDKFLAPDVKAYLYKETELPGNIVLPEQEETYWGFISVYILKPRYEMPLRAGQTYHLAALSGELPFKKFASDYLNKKPLLSLLNMVSLNQFGMVPNVTMPNEKKSLDIPLSHTLETKLHVQLPEAPLNRDIIYISGGSFNEEPSSFFPFDFKTNSRNDKAKEALLKTLPSSSTFRDTLFTLAVDLPSTTSDKRPLDTAILGMIQRPENDEKPIVLPSFLAPIDIAFDQNKKQFSYSDRRLMGEAPPSHVHVSFINVNQPKTEYQHAKSQPWWVIVGPSNLQKFTLPELPNGLSQLPKLPSQTELKWIFNILGINEKNSSFNYNDFTELSLTSGLSHFSQNRMELIPAKK